MPTKRSQYPSTSPETPPSYARPLLRWFDRHQRDLPWRKDRTPYRIWISEVMLQQTQVKTVVPYFERFVKRFPTVASLAQSPESEVLKLWEGLGYYRRARQLRAAAQRIVEHHGGEFPTDFDAVLALPGIGRYTAGAILSIALDQRYPILEGNTIRLYSRLLALKTDPRSRENQQRLWEFSASILPRQRAGDFNQALMELGSEICRVKSPSCPLCPLMGVCPTFAQGLQAVIPVAGRKLDYESIEECVVLIRRQEKFLVRRCQPGERWAGLWDFPRFRLPDSETIDQAGRSTRSSKLASTAPASLEAALAGLIQRSYGLRVELEKTAWQVRHAVTRFRISLSCFQSIRVRGVMRDKGQSALQTRWATVEELQQMPMSVTGRKLVDKLVGSKPD